MSSIACMICETENGKIIKCQTCTYTACHSCIYTWYLKENSCPYCRNKDTFAITKDIYMNLKRLVQRIKNKLTNYNILYCITLTNIIIDIYIGRKDLALIDFVNIVYFKIGLYNYIISVCYEKYFIAFIVSLACNQTTAFVISLLFKKLNNLEYHLRVTH